MFVYVSKGSGTRTVNVYKRIYDFGFLWVFDYIVVLKSSACSYAFGWLELGRLGLVDKVGLTVVVEFLAVQHEVGLLL